MESPEDIGRHTCSHCQSEVLTGKSCTPLTKRLLLHWWKRYESGTKRPLLLEHFTPDAVHEAALSGCPFFVNLKERLDAFSRMELKDTRLFFELEGVHLEQASVIGSQSADGNLLVPTTDHSWQKLYDITGCNVMAVNGYVIQDIQRFTTVSDWGMNSLFSLIRLDLQRFAYLQSC